MSYDFNFDLSKLSQSLFKEITEFSEQHHLHTKFSIFAKKLVAKFNVEKHTGLSVCDSITIIEDLIDLQLKNHLNKDRFDQAPKKVLVLPHCSRKYMDSRCKACFDPTVPTYRCKHCSSDCLIHKATELAQKHNIDIFVVPGGSCIKKICSSKKYDALIGVACTNEIKLGIQSLSQYNIPTYGIPLIKNGCSQTRFNVDALQACLKSLKSTSSST